MNKDIVQGHWHEVKGKIRQQWGDVTDDEIGKMRGTREELRGLIQQKYGYEQDRVEKEIDTFLNKNGWDN